jgi:hypothetical protein
MAQKLNLARFTPYEGFHFGSKEIEARTKHCGYRRRRNCYLRSPH